MSGTAIAPGATASLSSQLASGSWCPGGAGAFQTSFTSSGDRVAHIVGWALEYVAPLNEWMDQLTGDKAQVASFAATWSSAAQRLKSLDEDLTTAATLVRDQQGRTARALRKRLDDIRAVLTEAADWTGATASALQLASTIVTAVHDAVVGALSQLAGLIADLFGFSLNPFDKIDDLRTLVHRANEFIHVIGELISRMTTAFEQLVQLLQSLVPLIEQAVQELRDLLARLLKTLSPLAGAGGGPLGMLITGILGGAAADLIATDPRVTELDPDDLTPEQRLAWDQAQGETDLGSLSDLVRQNGYTDTMGGSDRSVVDIKKVVGADGEEHWVVSLPSTQDWDFPGMPDAPATNDLDSNVALMLNNPVLRTQYERAVFQAMQDAGVQPGDDVVYTGFSQGGIVAASIASHPGPYNTVGIVTNGSPIGTFAIPPSVQVVSFEHAGDPVPMLDGMPIDPGVVAPNRTNVVLPSSAGYLPGDTHNNQNYADDVATWEAAHPDQAQALSSLLGGTVVDHQMHTWSE
jgi:hypothetical protein